MSAEIQDDASVPQTPPALLSFKDGIFFGIAPKADCRHQALLQHIDDPSPVLNLTEHVDGTEINFYCVITKR